jgi:signal transduction histidine kinase
MYNALTNIETCYIQLPSLLYYSHIPTAIVALLLGIFVYFRSKSLAKWSLLIMSLSYAIWVVFDIILWLTHDSRQVLFFWSLLAILYSLIIFSLVFFLYSFISNKSFSFRTWLIFLSLFFPVLVITPTKYNLLNFDTGSCNAIENRFFLNYFLIFLGLIVILWILLFTIKKIAIANKNKDFILRKKIILASLGASLFLVSFYSTAYTASFLDNFNIEQFGLFGMVIFMAFLAYLIVRYKAFNIKLIGTQALVAVLVIGIGSQFFFIQNPTNRILNAVTFCLALGFGYFLVRSVKLEVQRKEELQSLSDQLAVANDKLRQLDKAKSEFISIASHQLRTPLTSIKGFSSLLLEGTYGAVPESQRPAVEKIYISNERLIQLVEDMLNISRIEAGRMEFDFQEAAIEDIADEAVKTLELTAKNKNLYLQWEKPAQPLPKLKLDITKIKEVISNMMDNAIKYTQKGGVTVRIEPGDKWVRVVVSDTGIGMDKEEIGMIFEKFQRGKQVSHYHTDGTGLGMYIGKKIVAEHKGHIWAESDGKGKGSRFILELPIA